VLKYTAISLAATLILFCFGCTSFIQAQGSENRQDPKTSHQATAEAYLKGVSLGTFEQSPCTPAVPSSDWDGVIISAPRHDITYKAGERPVVPVCGYYLVPVLDAMDGPPLTVHAGRIHSDAVISGVVDEAGENEPLVPPPPGAPRPSRESFEGVSTGGYFTIDAQKYLPTKLSPGSYEVTVSFAGKRSNAVQIEIQPAQ